MRSQTRWFSPDTGSMTCGRETVTPSLLYMQGGICKGGGGPGNFPSLDMTFPPTGKERL